MFFEVGARLGLRPLRWCEATPLLLRTRSLVAGGCTRDARTTAYLVHRIAIGSQSSEDALRSAVLGASGRRGDIHEVLHADCHEHRLVRILLHGASDSVQDGRVLERQPVRVFPRRILWDRAQIATLHHMQHRFLLIPHVGRPIGISEVLRHRLGKCDVLLHGVALISKALVRHVLQAKYGLLAPEGLAQVVLIALGWGFPWGGTQRAANGVQRVQCQAVQRLQRLPRSVATKPVHSLLEDVRVHLTVRARLGQELLRRGGQVGQLLRRQARRDGVLRVRDRVLVAVLEVVAEVTRGIRAGQLEVGDVGAGERLLDLLGHGLNLTDCHPVGAHQVTDPRALGRLPYQRMWAAGTGALQLPARGSTAHQQRQEPQQEPPRVQRHHRGLPARRTQRLRPASAASAYADRAPPP
mmetsp:Transcript_55099/g.141893  ORF Transcript_55099/g.141893 Transcript_55099/m.141893 type:complete len:411 (-) Transcript_55099:12-1244(-)